MALREALHAAVERLHTLTTENERLRACLRHDVTYGELDTAFTVIESTLEKYYALIIGGSLVAVEPTPQFNTHEVFTFPWISKDDDNPNPTET